MADNVSRETNSYERELRQRYSGARDRLGLPYCNPSAVPVSAVRPMPPPCAPQQPHSDVKGLPGALADLRGRVPCGAVVRAAAAYYGVKVAELQGSSRTASIVKIRATIIWICKRLYDKPNAHSAIGRALCRDHSSILHHSAKHGDEPPDAQGAADILTAIKEHQS